MDDCFVPWRKLISISTCIVLLTNLNDNITNTVEQAKYYYSENENNQKLNFLDIMIILHNNGKIDTDIFYRITNTHNYLRYHARVKNSIPFTLAKKITNILFG